MAIQQLDLFAAFQPPTEVEEKKPEVQPVVDVIAEPAVEIIPEPVVEFAPPLVEERTVEIIIAEEPINIISEPVASANKSTEKASIVFQNDTIGVKIKPKATLHQPVIAKATESVVVKLKSKRGRKSYKEIDAELDLVEVPEEEVLNQKLYYSITEVARWFKVNASLLRYWENEFDILKPRKNRKGDRLFRPEDIRNLQVIYYLLRNRKFSLEGAKKYLRNHRQQADVNVQLAQSLTKFRSFLLELKANLGA